jgi:hypothetical protein
MIGKKNEQKANTKFIVKLKKTATQTYLLCEVYGGMAELLQGLKGSY